MTSFFSSSKATTRYSIYGPISSASFRHLEPLTIPHRPIEVHLALCPWLCSIWLIIAVPTSAILLLLQSPKLMHCPYLNTPLPHMTGHLLGFRPIERSSDCTIVGQRLVLQMCMQCNAGYAHSNPIFARANVQHPILV